VVEEREGGGGGEEEKKNCTNVHSNSSATALEIMFQPLQN